MLSQARRAPPDMSVYAFAPASVQASRQGPACLEGYIGPSMIGGELYPKVGDEVNRGRRILAMTGRRVPRERIRPERG